MYEHRKIYRVFQLIARLRAPLGCNKKEVAEVFEVTERTIERYFNLLTELGFHITRSHNRHRIEQKGLAGIKQEEYINFTLEEAALIKKALFSLKHPENVQKNLLDKLYTLTELDELSDMVYDLNLSKNISVIRYAKQNEEQICLVGYNSMSNEKPRNYTLEPIRFFNYYRYLMAFDIKAAKVKQFKTERIGQILKTGKPWEFAEQHTKVKVDAFGMTGSEDIEVCLGLSKRARYLLEEEYPETLGCITKTHDVYEYVGVVHSLKGVGRFVMGLMDEVQVIKPKDLVNYIHENCISFQQRH
jgi:proteasome accessory factor C